MIFFYDIHPFIQNKYILISHNYFQERPMKKSHRKLFLEGKIGAWYAYGILPKTPLPNFYCLPRGMRNFPLREDTSKKWISTLNEVLRHAPFSKKPLSIACESDPLEVIAASDFILISTKGSPKTEEALALQTIPILSSSLSSPSLSEYPLLFLEENTSFPSNEDLLRYKKQKFSSSSHFFPKRLFLSYWIEQIQAKQIEITPPNPD